MLIKYAISNYKTYLYSTEIDFKVDRQVSTYETSKRSTRVGNQLVLKNLNLIGTDNVGKSNYISSLRMLKRMVLDGSSCKEEYQPFKFEEGKEKEPTKVNIIFTVGTVEYQYVLKYGYQGVVYERLQQVELDENKYQNAKVIYTRIHQEVITEDRLLKAHLDEIDPQKLVLYQGISWAVRGIIPVYTWFKDNLIILDLSGKVEITDRIESYLKDKGVSFKLSLYMSKMDPSISKVELDKNQCYLVHKTYTREGTQKPVEEGVRIPIENESYFIQRQFQMGLYLMLTPIFEYDKTLVIDNFGDKISFNLFNKYLTLVNEKENTSQVLFTTNNDNIFKTRLRVDQISLICKTERGISLIVSLEAIRKSIGAVTNNIKREVYKRYQKGFMQGVSPYEYEEMKKILFRN